jgi:UDP:flavonoid glycosyltransferase YjiC (YdhE family)
VWGAGVQQLKIGTAQRFSDATADSLVADLTSILAPEYRDRARNIAAQMMSPQESASCAADLIETATQAV